MFVSRFVSRFWRAAATLGGLCSLVVAGGAGGHARAALALGVTRIIVSAANPQATVPVMSRASAPLLLQAWVDDRDEAGHAPMPDAALPFIVDPPVARLDAGQSRHVRVLLARLPQSLPADRESLYWFNLLEVAARPAADRQDADRLEVSVVTRIKLFYRPAALAGIRHRVNQNTVARLRFGVQHDDAGEPWLVIDNPAPIHQSLARLTLVMEAAATAEHSAENIAGNIAGNIGWALPTPMVAPFASARVRLPTRLPVAPSAQARLQFASLDDDGSLIEDEQLLTP